ncbi:hypothetical protein NE237_028836 [Protea cynaroides]|uniref:Uncharacterized protein n=1 Tax=Protea cynaroides TaxID=273540 RepID=A0A9Q0GR10_9MAGN|nr:hypothetical protein NE237_028836 [Protea cynaroides]
MFTTAHQDGKFYVKSVVEDILYLGKGREICFNYVLREANKFAHSLAKRAIACVVKSLLERFFCFDRPSTLLRNSLLISKPFLPVCKTLFPAENLFFTVGILAAPIPPSAFVRFHLIVGVFVLHRQASAIDHREIRFHRL